MKTNFECIPYQLKELNQWVCSTENSKVPQMSNELKAASTTNPSTWSSFEDAKDSVEVGNYDYIGFVFNDNNLVGIDIDNGEDIEMLNDIVSHCKSYTEKSKSGRGVHIFVQGKLPWKGKNNRKGVEIYQASRYFITTGNVVGNYNRIMKNQEAIDYVIKKYFPEELREVRDNLKKEKFYKPIFHKPSKHCICITPEYPKIPDGLRNISLTSLGGQLHSLGLSKKIIYRELLKVNKIACSPPIRTSEIENIVESVCRYRRK